MSNPATTSSSALRVLFLSPSSSPTPRFSLCSPSGSSLSCGSAVSPPVTALGGGQWAADVNLPSAQGAAAADAGQWVLKMQTDQGVVYSSPFPLGSSAQGQQPNAAGAAPLDAPTGSDSPPAVQTQTALPTASAVQLLQTLVMTGTPLPSTATPSLTLSGTASPSVSCTTSPCPTISPSSAASAPSPTALALALALCLPVVFAMCLFVWHFCRKRRRNSGPGGEDCIFPPSPPLRQIERLEALSKPLPPLVTCATVGDLEKQALKERDEHDFQDEKADFAIGGVGGMAAAMALADRNGKDHNADREKKALPPPPPAYEGITRKRAPELSGDLEKALLALGRVLSDSTLARLPSLRRSATSAHTAGVGPASVGAMRHALSEPVLPVPAMVRGMTVRRPGAAMGSKRVSWSDQLPASEQPQRQQPQYGQPSPAATYSTSRPHTPGCPQTPQVRAQQYGPSGEEASTTYVTPLETPGFVCGSGMGDQALHHQMEHEQLGGYFPVPVAQSSMFPPPPAPTPGPGPAPYVQGCTQHTIRHKTPALPDIRSATPIQLPHFGDMPTPPAPARGYYGAPPQNQAVRHLTPHAHPPQHGASCGCSQHVEAGRAPGAETGRRGQEEETYPIELLGAYVSPMPGSRPFTPEGQAHTGYLHHNPQQQRAYSQRHQVPPMRTSSLEQGMYTVSASAPPMHHPDRETCQARHEQTGPQPCSCGTHTQEPQVAQDPSPQGALYGPRTMQRGLSSGMHRLGVVYHHWGH